MYPPPYIRIPPFPQQHPPAQQQQSDPNFSPLVIALIGILASAFLLVSYYTVIAKYCTKWEALRPRGQRDEGNDPFPVNESWPVMTRGLDESVIESIPVFKYKPGDMMVDDTECAVCLSEFQEDESLRLLPKCTHAFHVPCIDMWLTSHSNCPLCRANIVNPPASPRTTEGEETGNEENSESTIDSPLQEQSESEAVRESSEDESGRRTVSETRGLLPISHIRAQSDLVLKHERSDSSSQSRRLALSEMQQQYKAMRRCYSVDSSRRIAISITDLLAIHLALEDGKLKGLQSSSEAGGSGSFTVSFVPTPTSSGFIATSVSSRFAPTPVSSRFVPISASSSLDLEDGKSRSLSSVYEAQVGPSFSVLSSNPAEEQSLATDMSCASSKILNKQCSVDRNKSTMRRSFSGGKFFFLRNSRGRNAPILPP